MKEREEHAIKKIAKGSLIIFLGIFLSTAAFFLYRIIAARYLGPADYGLFTLGFTILNIASIIALAGMHHSVGKFINHYLAGKEYHKAKGLIISSFAITLPLGILISILTYFSSGFLSNAIFGIMELRQIIAIFAIGIPFSVASQLLKYYFYAFKTPQHAIISESLFEKMLSLVFLFIIIFFSSSVGLLSLTYILSLIISSVAAFFLFNPSLKKLLGKNINASYNLRKLAYFSFPLMITGLFGAAVAWTDTILIGIFMSEANVGLYNAAYVIASSLIIFWLSIGDIFYPIISELHSIRSKNSIKAVFEISSRWIFISTLPIIVIVLLFPTRLLSIFFGQAYLEAALPLAILVIGYFFTTYFGLAEQGLRTHERTSFLGIATISAFILNVAMAVILIPLYGITGAAIATTTTLLAVNSIKYMTYKKILKFGYDKKLYAKYIASCLISAILFYVFRIFGLTNTPHFLLSVFIYFAFYIALIFLFGGLSKEDKSIIEAIKRKIGIANKL